MKKSRRIAAVFVMLFAALMMFKTTTAYADFFIARPFSIESEDGSRVFIFNDGALSDDNLPATGVYYNTDPLELIYLVEGLRGAYIGNFFFSSDFQHFAFIPAISQDIVLEFYHSGALIRGHHLNDLVRNVDMVRFSASTALWEDRAGRSFDSINNALTITTIDNQTYTFDITTDGRIIAGFGNLSTFALSTPTQPNLPHAPFVPDFGPDPMRIIGWQNMGFIIGLAALVVGIIIFAIVQAARKRAAQRFYAENPDVSIIYTNSRWTANGREALEVKKIDGRRPHYGNNGIYILQGRRQLAICRKTYLPKRIDSKELPDAMADIDNNKGYFLVPDWTEERYKLVEIPNFENLDKVALFAYINGKARRGEFITEEDVKTLGFEWEDYNEH